MFKEIQYFRKSKAALILFGVTTLILVGTVFLVLFKSQESYSEIITVSVVNGVILLALGLLFYFSKLEPTISQDGIRYRYPIFVWKEKFIPWTEITEYNVREYSPLREFGGWGYRRNIFKKATCLNVSGNIGLDVQLQSGQQLVIGTQKENQLRDALIKLKREDFG